MRAIATAVLAGIGAAILWRGYPAGLPGLALVPVWLGVLAWNGWVALVGQGTPGTGFLRRRGTALAGLLALAALPPLLHLRQDRHEEQCVRRAEEEVAATLSRSSPAGLPAGFGRFVELRGSGHFRPHPFWDIAGASGWVVATHEAVFQGGSLSLVLVMIPVEPKYARVLVSVGPRDANISEIRNRPGVTDTVLQVHANSAEFLGRGYWFPRWADPGRAK